MKTIFISKNTMNKRLSHYVVEEVGIRLIFYFPKMRIVPYWKP